tara:strand:+ start:2054 stop:2818 length:765 start_codon:yes stop_codon:yes gene_type:complete
MVEAHFPGTAVWINTPLWRLMDAESVELDDIAAAIGAARPHLAKHVRSRSKTLARPMTIDSLWRQGDLPALSALLAIVRHAEITKDLPQYVEASWAALHSAIFLSTTTALLAVREEFLDSLWSRFFCKLQILPSPLSNAWPREQSLTGLQEILDEAARRQTRFANHRDLAQLAFWVTRDHPLFLIPAKTSCSSLLNEYEAEASTGKRYSADPMNFIQKSHFYIMRSPISRQGELMAQMDAGESTFAALPEVNVT